MHEFCTITMAPSRKKGPPPPRDNVSVIKRTGKYSARCIFLSKRLSESRLQSRRGVSFTQPFQRLNAALDRGALKPELPLTTKNLKRASREPSLLEKFSPIMETTNVLQNPLTLKFYQSLGNFGSLVQRGK